MDYTQTIQELKDYYSNTLIIQYNGKPKAKATIEMLVDLVFDNAILNQIQDAFDWKTAVGKQLDIIGKWVGVSRSYNFNPLLGTKLSYPQYERIYPTDITDAQQHGYSDYATFADDDGGQLTYKDLQSVDNALNDDTYRVVIGLKIIYNSINHVAGEIDNAIWNYFDSKVYTTWQAHTIVYNYPDTEYYQELMQICENKGVLPAPIGTNILLRGIE